MTYSFEILGVSPILHFFNHQHNILHRPDHQGAEYVGAFKCTLDAVMESVESVLPRRGWSSTSVLNSVVDFWLKNPEIIQHWQVRLSDAGQENLLVARVADDDSLRHTLESVFRH